MIKKIKMKNLKYIKNNKYKKSNKYNKKVYFILIFILFLFICSMIYLNNFNYEIIFNYLKQNSKFAPILYILIMILAIIISPIPSMPLAIFSGYYFGIFKGFLYTMIGAMIGAILAFFIGRYFKDFIINKFGLNIKKFENLSENKIMISIFITRLIPLFQFDIISYGAAITNIRLSKFIIATFFGMMPVTFLMVYSSEIFTKNFIYTTYILFFIIISYFIFKYRFKIISIFRLGLNSKR